MAVDSIRAAQGRLRVQRWSQPASRYETFPRKCLRAPATPKQGVVFNVFCHQLMSVNRA
jgi:hypothetical protein